MAVLGRADRGVAGAVVPSRRRLESSLVEAEEAAEKIVLDLDAKGTLGGGSGSRAQPAVVNIWAVCAITGCPRGAWTDRRGLDAIYEAIIGSSEFGGSVDLPGTTRGQRAVVALLLVDALVANGGFELADVDLLRFAREASELVGAQEHRALLDSRDGERWLALEAALRERLAAYVESHKDEFFTESGEAHATWERVKVTFTAEGEWLARTIAEVDRDVAGQEWLLHRFGDRGTYSETSALLLLRPDDMRAAIQAATEAGYQPREFAFYADAEGSPEFEPIDADPLGVLDAVLARHAADWVAVELSKPT